MPIPIIDLFAGPGGLGEGFNSVQLSNGRWAFETRLSIEKDREAVKTLTWRAFFRAAIRNTDPVLNRCYEIIQDPDLARRERRIEELLRSHPLGEQAREEVKQVELGSNDWPPDVVDGLISERLKGESNWVLIGGPPCQAYSNAGRSRVGGISKTDTRVYLYQEYLRILDKHRPVAFVMENVEGLLSAKVDGARVFDWIKSDLKLDGDYTLHSFVRKVQSDTDYLIRSEEFGVPQKRHRVILLGLRSDVKHSGLYLNPSNEVSLQSVIGELPKVRSVVGRKLLGVSRNEVNKLGRPKPRYQSVKDNPALWSKMLRDSKNQFRSTDLAKGVSDEEIKIQNEGAEFVPVDGSLSHSSPLQKWYIDPLLSGVLNHLSRSHLKEDLHRYFFATTFLKVHGRFPKMPDFQAYGMGLLPKHQSALSGKFTDRFRVQLPDQPATTVTSHISKDGHYFIHYDSEQMRSLTVREAARIQSFPDNYLFRGSRTSQFHQVGNAVPPYLAKQLGEIVNQIIKARS